MRILLVNYEFPPIGGGASRASYSIARELVTLGNEVVVLTSRFGDAPSTEEVDGMLIHRVVSWRKGIHDCGLRGAASFLCSAAPRLRWLLRSCNFDIVHYFFSLPTGVLSMYSHGLRNVPYIVSLRGSDVPNYDLESRKLRLMHGVTQLATRHIWRNAAKVVAVSHSLRLLAEAWLDGVKIDVIHNGADLLPSSEPKTFHASERLRIVAVSRLIPRKGLGDLLRAIAGLTDIDFELKIAGSGEAAQQLADLTAKLQLQDRVEFLGYQSQKDVRQLYSCADIFVLPTHSDAFANVILEAMSSGLPVIATDVGGAREAIEHGVNGLLVLPHDPDAIGEAIRRLAGDPELRQSMARENLARIQRQFTWPAVARQYQDVYANAIKQATPVAVP